MLITCKSLSFVAKFISPTVLLLVFIFVMFILGDSQPAVAATDPQPSADASAPAAQVDINSLFSKLLQHGIINKKEEVNKMEKIPDLTKLSDDSLLKQLVYLSTHAFHAVRISQFSFESMS